MFLIQGMNSDMILATLPRSSPTCASHMHLSMFLCQLNSFSFTTSTHTDVIWSDDAIGHFDFAKFSYFITNLFPSLIVFAETLSLTFHL